MRIIFFCGSSPDEWAPPRLVEGIGGSETAVIWIAKLFAQAGWVTDVYCHAGRYEGEHDGVGYWEPNRLRADERADVLVVWRNPAGWNLPVQADRRLLWLHDLGYSPGAKADLHNAAWDLILGVSALHAKHLARSYDLPLERVDYVPNGVDLSRFDPAIRKKPLQAIYASSADRGLLRLLDLWPKLIGDEDAKLIVSYGFNTMDEMIKMGRRDLAQFKEHALAKMKATRGVEFVGRLGQDELARTYGESVIWPYPTDFWETSCISAMEAMAGGCVPVCSSVGALKDTVGDGGLVVYGPNGTRANPYSPAWQEFWVQCARGVMMEMSLRKQAELAARHRAKALTWDASFARWQEIVARQRGDASRLVPESPETPRTFEQRSEEPTLAT